MHCPGSVKMEELYGNGGSSPASTEGEAVHEAAASLLSTGVYITTATNGVEITKDMEKTAEWYAQEVSTRIPKPDIEVLTQCPTIHPECYGTPDAVGRGNSALGELVIADLKTGYIPVEAYENWQLITYAAGKFNPLHPVPRITLCIMQSNPVPTVRVWSVSPIDLQPYWDRLRTAAAEALSPNPRTVTGGHCKYCSGRHACEAARSMSLWGYETALAHRELHGEELSTELSVMYAAQDAIKFRLTGLEAQAIASLQTGGSIPGWSLGFSSGRLKWSVSDKDAIALGVSYGVDISKPGVVTPKQAITAGVPKDMVSLFSAREGGGIVLEKSDPKKLFGGIL